MRVAANARVHHAAVLEPHLAQVVAKLGPHLERATLAAEIEELEHIVDAEIAEGSLDGHQAASVTREREPDRCPLRMTNRSSESRALAPPAPSGSSESASYQHSRASRGMPSATNTSPAAAMVRANSGSR